MTTGWTTVFRGPIAEALIVQSKLEAHEVPTSMPSMRVREVDPFITGADPLTQAVAVPAELVSDAHEVLGGDLTADRTAELGPEERDRRRLAGLARALRWSAMFSLIFPVLPALWGLVLGVRYRALSARLGERAPAHRFVPWALGLCVLMLFVHAGMVFVELSWEFDR